MAKLPWFKFFPGDWLKDPHLRKCSPETKGIWIDIICLMWEEDDRGILEGTYEELGRMLGQNTECLKRAATELKTTKTATVTFSNDVITIKSRRILRDERLRESNRSRQSKHRSNTNITVESQGNNQEKSEVRGQRSDEKDKSFSSDVVKLSEYFLQNCHKKIKKENINISNWNDAIEKMNRIDKRPFEEIKKIFNFMFTDQFWSNQAVGPISLRKKNSDGIMRYDVVLAKMNQNSDVSGKNLIDRNLPSDIIL